MDDFTAVFVGLLLGTLLTIVVVTKLTYAHTETMAKQNFCESVVAGRSETLWIKCEK